MVDYYQLLGVAPNATLDQIGKRYRFLAHAYHPDKFTNEQHKAEAAEAFKQIHEAFTTLSNPQLRAAYDGKRDYFASLNRRSPPPPQPQPAQSRSAQPQPSQSKPPPERPQPKPEPKPEPKRQPEPKPQPEPKRKSSPDNPADGKTSSTPKTTPSGSPFAKPRPDLRSQKKRLLTLAGLGVAIILLIVPSDTFQPHPAPTPAVAPSTETAVREQPRISLEPQPTNKLDTNSIGMRLASIPAGEYLIGSPTSELGNNDKHDSHELLHTVRITQPFRIGVYAVTQAEYEKLMGRNPSFFSKSGNGRDQILESDTSRLPVEQVSWFDAVEFCNNLSASEHRTPCYELSKIQRREKMIENAEVTILPGTGYRLPTEAEWESACRAGTTTPFSFGSALNGHEANCNGSEPYGPTVRGPFLQRTATGGTYPPNALGLYDMHGNVRQWCQDWYDEEYYTKSPANDPPGPAAGKERVVRGGGWFDSAVFCRSASRLHRTPDHSEKDLGFRVVMAAE